MSRHLHLDLVGGLSGDMFLSAMLDSFPAQKEKLDDVIRDAGFPDLVTLEISAHDDGVLTGTHVRVKAAAEEGHHHHRHYAEIRDTLEKSKLDADTRARAQEMFLFIAEVEAKIHGKEVAEVAFHEVGAWDSIADIVLAAYLISASGAESWSVSAIPAGSGFVQTAHGRLPVPAPATARLLEGFELIDDGIEGERVTPTGAAILKHLAPARQIPRGFQLDGTGYGFGTKEFPGISNVVRVSRMSKAETGQPWVQDQVHRLSFEVDDQTPESLAVALDNIRATAGVIDVSQHACWGKKNRQGFSVAVLCDPAQADAVIDSCFRETTTLGIRRENMDRAVLQREEITVFVGERPCRVKVAIRPGGNTAKAEMDDLSGLPREEQQRLRTQAESLALAEVHSSAEEQT